MRFARFGILPWTALLLIWPTSGSALAAAPSNDFFIDATPASIGFSQVLDTTEATTDADDAQLNVTCHAPATDASVWYAFQVPSDQDVVVDVSRSDYSAGVLVGVSSQGNLQTVVCGPRTVTFFAAAGTTYYVLAIDDQSDGGGNGGSLHIAFTEIPPPPTLDIHVNRFGTVNAHTGVATISGTYTCSNGNSINMSVSAQQNVGRLFTISGFGFFSLEDTDTCDGAPHPWSIMVVPQSGKFTGGKSLTMTFGTACGLFQCFSGFAQQTVQLRGGS